MRDTRHEILYFWFEETEAVQWFQKNDAFDQSIRDRFTVIYNMAKGGLCDHWKQDAEGCLALCIVLDQFPRNMFRDTGDAFATDEKALLTAKYAISRGFDQVLTPTQRRFMYLPFEHSERLSDQVKAVELFGKMKKEDPMGYEYAVRHKQVIEKYGRFPHRNAVLDRENTPDEQEYLAQPGAGF